VRVKNTAFAGAHAGGDRVLRSKDFVPRVNEGFSRRLIFLGQLRVGQLPPGDGRVGFADHKNLPPAHAAETGMPWMTRSPFGTALAWRIIGRKPEFWQRFLS